MCGAWKTSHVPCPSRKLAGPGLLHVLLATSSFTAAASCSPSVPVEYRSALRRTSFIRCAAGLAVDDAEAHGARLWRGTGRRLKRPTSGAPSRHRTGFVCMLGSLQLHRDGGTAAWMARHPPPRGAAAAAWKLEPGAHLTIRN